MSDKKTIRVSKATVNDITTKLLAGVEERFEKHMRASTARVNPTLGGKPSMVGPDDPSPSGAPPRGPGGYHANVSVDEARTTMLGFHALMQGDHAGALRMWKEIDGYGERAMQTDLAAAGGVLVPDGFLAEVITQLPNYTPFADSSLVRILPMAQPVVKVPRTATKPAKPGVVQEATAYPETQPVLGHVELVARKVGEIIPITEEMVMGAEIAVFQFLAELVAEQMADKRTELLTNGNGVNEPQGIRMEADVTTAAQAGSALVSDDIVDTFYGIKSAYRPGAFWFMNDAIAKAVRKLKDSNGRYMWTDGGGFGVAQPTLLGRPVYENPEISIALGSGADESEIIFGNWRQGYWLGTMAGLSMDTDSSGTDWKADITNLKFRERYDGKVGDPAAFIRLTAVVE